MNTTEETATGLDLSVQELEVMVGLGGNCGGNVDPNACDASLGGAISLSIAASVILIT
ncbi:MULTISPECIES: hypothetical protein [Amycolatopsis]|uniref:Uncharacterized protein n=2 Tax=Amycolatopsis TaxID=1813 RepID=A0A1I4DGY3_9PSEU|nr:hypothetical protein [Amycolatopsis sacchari]SFK92333.1 hypothetical protein SAMN05421835_14618 [Amycolatopsis sacchari]